MRENIIAQKSQQDFVFDVEKMVELKIHLTKMKDVARAVERPEALSRSEQSIACVAESWKDVS